MTLLYKCWCSWFSFKYRYYVVHLSFQQIAQSLKDEQKKLTSEASFSDVRLEDPESSNLIKSGMPGTIYYIVKLTYICKEIINWN